METRKNIIWLASYPKSGNTWFRSFITALRNGGEVNINQLNTEGIFSRKDLLESVLEIDADVISIIQLEKFRRISFQYQAAKLDQQMFVKIHDFFSVSKFDLMPLVPVDCTLCAIYLIRNPLDVVISLSNHNGKSVDDIIHNLINNATAQLGLKYKEGDQFTQFIGSWNGHVESWKNITQFPVYFIRYEDLKNKPLETFKNILNLIDYKASEIEIEKAIEACNFDRLKNQEIEFGFREKPKTSKRFFNQGKVDQWKEKLTISQIEIIKKFNEPMMREFGYWEI